AVPLLSNTTYTYSFYARLLTGTTTDMRVGYQNTVAGGDNDCLTGQTLSNSVWTRFSCTFTTGTTGSDSNIYVWFNTNASNRQVYFDGFQLENSTAATPYYDTQNNLQVDTLTSTLTINSNQNGELQPWQLSPNRLPAARNYGSVITANGYIYYVAGGST